MGQRKILFFDIDDTIFSRKTHRIPESTKSAIKQAKEKGHLVFVNTGRTKAVIGDDIKELNFDGYVCGCGTYIEVNDEVLYYKQLEKEKYEDIVYALKKYDLNGILEGKEALYVDEEKQADEFLAKLKKENYPIKPYDMENMIFDKVFIRYDENKYIDNFSEDIKEIFDYIDHGKGTREFVPKGHSKASGIDFLLEHFNVDREDTFAFGDSNNDIPMLENVANSIVMGNGNPELFEKATFVTKDIDEGGIEHSMRYFKIID